VRLTQTVVKRIAAVLTVGFAAGKGIYAIASHWWRSLLFGVNFTVMTVSPPRR